MIYRRSLDAGTLPRDGLEADMSSVYKNGDRHLAENYSSRLPQYPAKYWNILSAAILYYTNKILTNLKRGFRDGFSPETQLLTPTGTTIFFLSSERQWTGITLVNNTSFHADPVDSSRTLTSAKKGH